MLNLANQFDLQGKVAVVTGCSSGLGISFTEALLNNGANVVICARREKELQQTAKKLDPSGHRVIPVRADVTVQDDVDRLFQDCLLYTSPSPRDRTRSRMPSSA